MPRTEVGGDQILDESVQRKDLDTITPGQSVVRKVTVTGTGFQISYTGADIGTGDVEMSLDAGGFGTAYYPFEKDGEETTTSNGWVEYDLVTTDVVPEGLYVVHFTSSVANSSKKNLGYQVNWRPNSDPWIELHSSLNPPALADTYETRSSFKEIQHLTAGTISIQINYGQTIAGGTAKINSHDVYLFKVGELP
jgi:hypothetical protein